MWPQILWKSVFFAKLNMTASFSFCLDSRVSQNGKANRKGPPYSSVLEEIAVCGGNES